MTHIAHVTISDDTWIQYASWFMIKNYTPKDYRYSNGLLELLNSTVINDFYSHHPNLSYTTVEHPSL